MFPNDLDYKNWKTIKVPVDTLWTYRPVCDYSLFDEELKDILKFSNKFHGIFHPIIPYTMILRYTKEGETVWDCFAGSGITIDVCRLLKRNVIANDLYKTRDEIFECDSAIFDPKKKVQMIIMHPPYADIVKFGEKKEDLSNLSTEIDYPSMFYKSLSPRINNFLFKFSRVLTNVIRFLDKRRILILVCGEIEDGGEEIPLGFYCMHMVRLYGFKLLGWIVKDFGHTKVNSKNYNLRKYRVLRSGKWLFSFDNIFVLQKL